MDIAGLVKGASKGEGLGNKFLSHIRETDAIVHLVRCFKSEKIQHVNNKIDPISDLETIKTEILLADIDVIQKKLEKNKKKLLSEKEIKLLNECLQFLNKGKNIEIKDKTSLDYLNRNGLLSIKPKIIVCNVDEDSLQRETSLQKLFFLNLVKKIIMISADIEDQLSNLEKNDKEKFMKEIGLEKTGLNKLIKAGYDLLNLDTFLPLDQRRAKAWTIKKNTF